jgi:hypothetical protein
VKLTAYPQNPASVPAWRAESRKSGEGIRPSVLGGRPATSRQLIPVDGNLCCQVCKAGTKRTSGAKNVPYRYQ